MTPSTSEPKQHPSQDQHSEANLPEHHSEASISKINDFLKNSHLTSMEVKEGGKEAESKTEKMAREGSSGKLFLWALRTVVHSVCC